MAFTEQDSALMTDGPIPGESLTQSPENPQAWETPPDYTELESFVDDLFLNITSQDNLDGILDPLRQGVPVEDVAQMLLFQAMSTGKINTDLVLTAVEPTIYMLIGLGTFAEVEDMVLYPEDDMLTDEEDEVKAMEDELAGKPVDIESMPVPEGISKSLVMKLQDGDI